jgi:hypothetical protein
MIAAPGISNSFAVCVNTACRAASSIGASPGGELDDALGWPAVGDEGDFDEQAVASALTPNTATDESTVRRLTARMPGSPTVPIVSRMSSRPSGARVTRKPAASSSS